MLPVFPFEAFPKLSFSLPSALTSFLQRHQQPGGCIRSETAKLGYFHSQQHWLHELLRMLQQVVHWMMILHMGGEGISSIFALTTLQQYSNEATSSQGRVPATQDHLQNCFCLVYRIPASFSTHAVIKLSGIPPWVTRWLPWHSPIPDLVSFSLWQ